MYRVGVMLVDTHAHLCDPAFDPDRAEVLARARQAGVGAVVAVGETLAELERNLELAAEFPEMVRPCGGLFPTILDLDQAAGLEERLREVADRIAAVGEIGLDYWKVQDPGEREVQREIFTRFVRLAIELEKPVNVHSRSAGAATIERLLELGAKRVQMHAFDGRAAKALPGVEAGYYFTVPPSIARSPQKQKLVRRLPLECLLVETDSPVLGPDPAARNEPANAILSIRAIAELKELPHEQVAEAVRANTARLYGDLTAS